MASLTNKNFEETSRCLPSKIELSFEVPKIWEMALASSTQTVIDFIQFELIKLAERVNVSGNLTDLQIQAISTEIVNQYPNETIADFKQCFERASQGRYGKIWKLDGIEVGLWIKSFLDEKYAVLENELMKEKESFKNRVFNNPDKDFLKLWKEAIDQVDLDGGVKTMSANMHLLSQLRGMTDEDILKHGKEKPIKQTYPASSESEIERHKKHLEYIKANYDPITSSKLPGWKPENK